MMATKSSIRDKQELMLELKSKGTAEALALAYLIFELCPDDRTTKTVFKGI
jgi:hypothetical protein